ncbi:FtsQ-type POTRA domain-containing protein [Christensenellaceae bacterium OttesenSCG-928-M15]|nr:FtsQ-type POTRA domain-containing protein [Christensenellaceae bacterium OttesenSCG-928-M15]
MQQQGRKKNSRKGPQNTRVYAPTHPSRAQDRQKNDRSGAPQKNKTPAGQNEPVQKETYVYVTDKQWSAMKSGKGKMALEDFQKQEARKKERPAQKQENRQQPGRERPRDKAGKKQSGKAQPVEKRSYKNIHRIEQVDETLKQKRAPKQEPKKKKKREPMDKKHLLTILIVTVVLIGALLAGYFVFLLDTVEVEGLKKYSEDNIIELSGLTMGRHMLLLNLEEAAASIEQSPYLDVLSIEREYPSTIRITLHERQEAAAISSQGFYAIIDTDGHVLSVGSGIELQNLIRVTGMSQHTFTLNQPIGAADDVQAAALREILKGLEELSLMGDITEIDVSNPLRSTLKTTEGITVLLGQTTGLLEKLEWLKETLPSLRLSDIKTGTLDLSAKGGPIYSPPRTTSRPPANTTPEEGDALTIPDSEGDDSSAPGDGSGDTGDGADGENDENNNNDTGENDDTREDNKSQPGDLYSG